MRHALVLDELVTDIILWDGTTEYEPGGEHLLLPAPDDVAVGWSYVNGEWVAPAPSEPIPEPDEDSTVTEARLTALAEMVSLGVSEATARVIVGLPPNPELP